jgi:hypothetical protein
MKRLFFSAQIVVFICLLCYFQLAALVHYPGERVEITVKPTSQLFTAEGEAE